MIAPPNVVLPKSASGQSEPVNGIYTLPGTSDPTSVCCWLAPHATLPVEKRRHTRVLYLSTYLPRRALIAHKPKLSIQVQGLRRTWKWNPERGFTNTRILLPASFTNVAGVVDVTINCTCEAKIGNARYAIVLNSVIFE